MAGQTSGLAFGSAVSGTLASGSDRLNSIHESVRGRVAATGIHTVGRNLAESASDHAEHLDFFSENSIGACVTCCISMVIWLVFLPIFHLGAVPWMSGWEAMHDLTLMEYMGHAEETFATPHGAFEVLDADGDGNSTQEEFTAGSGMFKRPPFRYPADMYPIFSAIDANKDGKLQNAEFYRATPSGMEMKWHMNMTDLKVRAKEGYGYLDSYYTAMDINSDGKVDELEFTNMAKMLEPPVPVEDAKALFHKADTDGMGFIEPREWVSYTVEGNFTFQASLAPGIIPDGPRVMVAVEAGLRAALQVQESDMLTVTGLKQVVGTDSSESSGDTARKLSDDSTTTTVGYKTFFLKVSCQVLLGTRARRQTMQAQLETLPNNVYMEEFGISLAGGSTTAPIGPMTTGQPIAPGPLTAKELEEYMEVPAVIQGHTELTLSHAEAGTHSVEEQETALKPIFQDSITTFCSCSLSVDSVQTTVVQDTTGAGLATNKSMVLSWSGTLEHGGEFEKKIQASGHELVTSINDNIMKANLPCMVGVKLDLWTRFTADYYGSAAASLTKGTSLKQYFGHFHLAEGGIRNDTGTAPFVGSLDGSANK